jgi:hypothetical protein
LDRIIEDPLVHMLCVRMMEEAGRIGKAIGIPPTVSAEDVIVVARTIGDFKDINAAGRRARQACRAKRRSWKRRLPWMWPPPIAW